MPIVELSDRFCQSAKVSSGRKADYFDAIVKGLCLRASAGGAKAFFLVYSRPPDGKRAWLKLGAYPEMRLAKAREQARSARGAVSEGGDPIAEKRAHAASQTVADVVENYIVRHAASRRSGKAIARRLRKNVSGVIGDARLTELHRRDLTRCIDAVTDRGATIEANRVFEDMRAMIRWARGRGDLDQNLMEGMRKPAESKPRERVLSADEIRVVWKALPKAEMRESTRRILRLCLSTLQRVGEISGMRREEIDLEQRLWTIPPERTKNRQQHKIPLSDLVIGIINEQLADVDALDQRYRRGVTPFVFPGPGARAATTGHAIAKAVKREEKPAKTGGGETLTLGVAPWTPHDLRRSAATHVEGIGVSPFIIGHVLNHVSVTRSTVTSSTYARHDYAREKREAVELWGDRLAGIVEGKGEVVPIRKAVA